MIHFPSEYTLGDAVVRYTRCPRTGIVELSCFPSERRDRLVPPLEVNEGPHIDGLPARWLPQYSHEAEWLVQVKLAGSPEPGGHQAGRSLRGAPDLAGLTLAAHALTESPNGNVTIVTDCTHPRGYLVVHDPSCEDGENNLRGHPRYSPKKGAAAPRYLYPGLLQTQIHVLVHNMFPAGAR